MLVLSRVSLGVAGDEQVYQVARMIKGNHALSMLPVHTGTFWIDTWGRLESTHGGVLGSTHGFFHFFFSACRTTHTAHQTHTHNYDNNKTPTKHNITRRQTQRDRDGERQCEKRETESWKMSENPQIPPDESSHSDFVMNFMCISAVWNRTQNLKRYANDADELKRNGLFKKSKARVAKCTHNIFAFI